MRIRPSRDTPTFVFIVLVLVSFILMTFDARRTEQEGFVGVMRSGAAALFGPLQTGIDSLTDPIFEFIGGVASFATLRQQNESLLRENEELRARNQEVARLELEVEQLRALLDLEFDLELETTPIIADVTGATEDGGLIISKGSESGIVVGMPVLNDSQLLIGRVVQATERQAVIELLIDTTDAVIVDSPEGITGILTGTGRADELRISVEFGAVEVPEGTVFSTAGFGLPRGLQVAYAHETLQPLGDQITDARVTPLADFSRLPRYVLIIPILEVPSEEQPPDSTGSEESPPDGEGSG